LTYDVYKTYFNPYATEEQILRVGHAAVALYAVVCGLAGVIFFFIGVSMGWLYTFMGVILGSAVCPIALAITWSKANKSGCIWGSVAGFVAGVIAWLVTTAKLNKAGINVVTSGGDYEMLAGNVASIGVGAIVSTLASLIYPEDYDFETTRAINKPEIPPTALDEQDGKDEKNGAERAEVKDKAGVKAGRAGSFAGDSFDAQEESDELDPVALNKAFKFATWSSVALFVVLILLIPLPLFFSQHVYTVGGFTGWVSVGIIWTFLSSFTVVIYPLYESRGALKSIAVGVFKDLFTRGSGKYVPKTARKAEQV